MKDKSILSKKMKILLLKILKSGEISQEQAKEIVKPFENSLTIDEAKTLLLKLEQDY